MSGCCDICEFASNSRLISQFHDTIHHALQATSGGYYLSKMYETCPL